jgi:pyroglutamyl-peptidase
MKTILLTGFGTWGENTYNSSWEILSNDHFKVADGWQTRTLQLPVSWSQSPKLLGSHITSDVKAVVCFGMTSAKQVMLERLATNQANQSLADVDGLRHVSEFVCETAPPAYWTGLPIKAIQAALAEQKIPCAISHWPGDYLCGFIFYWLMHHISCSRPEMTGGFIHVPPFGENGMEREKLCSAVPVIVTTVISSLDG